MLYRNASLLLVPAVVAGLAGCGSSAVETVELTGRGATFVEPIMQDWKEEYHVVSNKRVRVSYTGTGSGNGIAAVTEKTVQFGCSDAPMSKKQLEAAVAAGGPVVHVPLVLGAVVPLYRLDGVDKPITFSGPLLADVFLGKVAAWDDPRLRELNPGVKLPGTKIQPVMRADPSGTSFIFADYLAKVSPEFKTTVGVSNDPKWPDKGSGIKQPKSDGVAGYVANTNGAIGYIELTYALDKKAQYGAVVNKAGKPVLANLDSITAAAAATVGVPQTAEPYSLHDLTYSLTEAAGDGSYPIAGLSFAVVYQQQAGPKGQATVAFLKWVTSADGQALAQKRNYAPLPAELQQKVAAKLATIELK